MSGARRALYVGRFQPFHLGHLEAVRYILSREPEIIIVVGSAQYSHSLDNPFTTGERVTMIRLALDEAGINPSRYFIIPVPDLHMHMTWVAYVVNYVPRFDVVYTNEPVTHRLFLESGYRVESIPYFRREVYSATEIRRRILCGESWEELVPRSVARFIKEIGGEQRLRDLAKTDKV